jgi:hypothetical protein
MGQGTHDIALKLDFIGSSLPHVRKFEGVVNVLQVHVFLHCPRKQLLFLRKFGHRAGLYCFIGELLQFPGQFAELGQLVAHSLYS